MVTLTSALAVVGAVTGVSSLAWNIYVKISAGPKIVVKVWPGMKMMPTPPNDPTYMRVNVRNLGTTATKLTTLGLHLYNSEKSAKKLKPDRSFVIVEPVAGKLPHRLEVGDEWDAYINQDERFNEMMKTGQLFCAVYHSFSDKFVQARVPGSADSMK